MPRIKIVLWGVRSEMIPPWRVYKMIGKWQGCHRRAVNILRLPSSSITVDSFPCRHRHRHPSLADKRDDDLLAPVNMEFAFFAVHHCIGLLQRNIRILRLLPAREHCKGCSQVIYVCAFVACVGFYHSSFAFLKRVHYAMQIKYAVNCRYGIFKPQILINALSITADDKSYFFRDLDYGFSFINPHTHIQLIWWLYWRDRYWRGCSRRLRFNFFILLASFLLRRIKGSIRPKGEVQCKLKQP